MEKRAIFAIILTFLIIIFWSFIQSKLFPPQPIKSPIQEEKREVVSPIKEAERRRADEESLLIKEKIPIKGEVIPTKEVVVETRNYIAIFTSEGARLKHFKLKNYKDRVNQSAITIKLTQFVKKILGYPIEKTKEPEPLDLINIKEENNLPLRLTLPSFNGNWRVDKEQLNLGPGEVGEITFFKDLGDDLKIIKRFKFISDQYKIDMDVEVTNQSLKEIKIPVGLEWIGKIELIKLIKENNKDYGLSYYFLRGEKIEKKQFGGASTSGCVPSCGAPQTTIEPFEIKEKGEIKWFSFGGEYFTALLIPPPSQEISLSIKGLEENRLIAEISPSPFSIPNKDKIKINYQIYLGPKDENHLKALGIGAEKLVDFGFFTIIAKPILWFLRLTHLVTKNYGLDIIILSILIKIIFLPLTQISMKSMKEMQKVQPEMKRLQQQYKNDKAKLQQEIMLLYKRRKINPLSGCLPMLIQIPVFIALYNALQNGIEMRHAPFFLWILDLSAKDPIYVTPLIMGATMVIQQKMTPTATDPTQAKMFLLMPIMFTFLFLNFPSGLVLYWLINNVLSIAHQYYINKKK